MKKYILVLLALPALLTAAAQLKPDQKLRVTQGIIETYYVDSVNSDKMVEDAIVAMLTTLDPHSAYSNAEETKALNEPLEGNFSGIGIQFNMVQDTLYVIQTIAGGPSEQVGIRAGDRIIAANDTTIAGVKMQNRDIMKRLRGPKGSEVFIDVIRHGEPGVKRYRIVRDDIPLYSVDAAYMADPTTGYVRISRFAAETPREFATAVNKLIRSGMKNLIIDLEDNGGGYLGAAVELAGHFLRNNDVIVYTKGRNAPEHYFRAEGNGKLRDGRVVIMVNEFSASASEILSGALQDNDRGLVVGRRTFGKGLVQRPFPFPDGSMIRLTVSRYYTPAGRSIQKPYAKGDDNDYFMDLKHRYDKGEFSSADSIHFADSLRYETLRHHRTVYGGGGIMPDRFVPIDTTGVNAYYRELRAKNAFSQYTVDYIDANRKQLTREYPTMDSFIKGFEFTPRMMDNFVSTAEKLGVKPNPEQLEESRNAISTILKGLIARDLFDYEAYYRIANELNPVYREALRLINSSDEYDSLLNHGSNK